MPRAVRFDGYGDIDVLKVVEVPRPVPGSGQVLVHQMQRPGVVTMTRDHAQSAEPAVNARIPASQQSVSASLQSVHPARFIRRVTP